MGSHRCKLGDNDETSLPTLGLSHSGVSPAYIISTNLLLSPAVRKDGLIWVVIGMTPNSSIRSELLSFRFRSARSISWASSSSKERVGRTFLLLGTGRSPTLLEVPRAACLLGGAVAAGLPHHLCR